MTPLKVKKFLSDQRSATLLDIAKYFNISKALACELLRFWIKKGNCIEVHACNTCQLCPENVSYQWKSICIES